MEDGRSLARRLAEGKGGEAGGPCSGAWLQKDLARRGESRRKRLPNVAQRGCSAHTGTRKRPEWQWGWSWRAGLGVAGRWAAFELFGSPD